MFYKIINFIKKDEIFIIISKKMKKFLKNKEKLKIF